MALSELDHTRLQEALALAHTSIGLSEPNPRVGCILGWPDGRVLGRGATQEVGGPHAEVMALRDARSAGGTLQGATAWVTLEPCAHHGRTPPCCDALIEAGVLRVVVAVDDPFPQVSGQGIARLRSAGVTVDLADGEIRRAAREINVGFFSRIERGRPWVRLKSAASLDGRTALNNGASQWITGAAARQDGHAWRRRAGVVLTGIGTVLADDPRMDVRLVDTRCQPLRVVLDSKARTPVDARLLAPPGRALIITADPPPLATQRLREAGAEVIALPSGPNGIDLDALLAELASRQVNELHLEAGARLSGSLLRAGLVDELLLYLAPKLLGAGRGIADLGELDRLDEAIEFTLLETVPLGADLRVRASVRPR